MNLGPYANFILSAYGAAALIVTAMVAWVVIDHRRQARALADLEARGVTRRSAERQGAPTSGAAPGGALA
jgi:heme exporter protein D